MMYKNDFVATVKAGGKILRENDNMVYLPFDSEYSIYMKNLRSQRVVVNIDIDGRNVTGSGLVINGNSTIDLERFIGKELNKGNKFKFIQKTEKIQEFRGDKIDDGIIRIEFQYEKPCIINTVYPWVTLKSYNDYTHNVFTTSSVNSNFESNDSITINNVYLNSINKPLLDEGITVEGSISNQTFNEVTIGVLEAKKHVITLQLKGITETNDAVKTLITVKTKKICKTCGKTNKSFANFCIECGTSLQIIS